MAQMEGERFWCRFHCPRSLSKAVNERGAEIETKHVKKEGGLIKHGNIISAMRNRVKGKLASLVGASANP